MAHPSIQSTLSFIALLLLVASYSSSNVSVAKGSNQSTNHNRQVIGPIPIQRTLTMYFLVDKDGAFASVKIRSKLGVTGERVMVRAFDRNEKLSYWRLIERKPSLSKQQRDVTIHTAEIPLNGPGIHQLRITAQSLNSQAEIAISSDLSYGICFQNGLFAPWKSQPKDMYVYIPKNSEELEIAGGPLQLVDETGRERLATAVPDLSKNDRIRINATEVVWRVIFPTVNRWQFRVAGIPFILCSTKEAAEKLLASTEVLNDGTVVCWKFQRRIAELLPEVLSKRNIGDLERLIVPISDRKKEWLLNPDRNSCLVGPYALFPAVEQSLRLQNVDSYGHWGGAIGGWQNRIGNPTPQNRWDRLRSIGGLVAGASPDNGAAAEHLAQAALLDAPFNPYFGKQELLFRATAAAFRDLMTLGEDENWRGVGSDMDDYPGYQYFPIGQKTLPVYARTSPHMPPSIRAVWTEGLGHLIDRCAADRILTTSNQSAHMLLANQDFAEGSALSRYRTLAEAFAKQFVSSQAASGYFMEAFGPDSSYTGITHWFMSVYYKRTKNPIVLGALKRSYQFFNHTVAPEPDGHMLGGFNFNHRIGDGFFNEQWGGARGILDDILPEVGLWALTPERKSRTQALASALSSSLESQIPLKKQKFSNIDSVRYYYWAAPASEGMWPALESQSFIRNFGNELIAVKRPAYYSVIYVGKPAPSEYYIRNREKLRHKINENPETHNPDADIREISPLLGGGLSMFWTPDYGTSILAANWSPLAHNGLVAQDTRGACYWEDYFKTTFRLDEPSSSLVISGSIEHMPIQYERSYKFEDSSLQVQVLLTACEDINLSRLQENIPIASGPMKTNGVTIESTGNQGTNKFTILDSRQKGVEIDLDKHCIATLGKVRLKSKNLQISSITIELPPRLRKGQVVRFGYEVKRHSR